MDNQPSDMRESLWRRTPSAAERAKLGSQPDLELEARLTEALSRMPEAPVACNFTSRVLAAIDLDELQTARARTPRRWNWQRLVPRFFPRVAVASAVLMFAGLSVRHYEISSRNYTLAREVAMVTTSQPVPSIDALENLDAIQSMSQSSHADGELLADLQ